jgi:hypothetical protein
VSSAHLASLSSSDSDRRLPIFWALDYFKSSQAQDVHEGNWTMGPLDESAVPPARKAFVAALDTWDESAVDAAVASLARSAGSNEVYELFFRFGARDFRSIGQTFPGIAVGCGNTAVEEGAQVVGTSEVVQVVGLAIQQPVPVPITQARLRLVFRPVQAGSCPRAKERERPCTPSEPGSTPPSTLPGLYHLPQSARDVRRANETGLRRSGIIIS